MDYPLVQVTELAATWKVSRCVTEEPAAAVRLVWGVEAERGVAVEADSVALSAVAAYFDSLSEMAMKCLMSKTATFGSVRLLCCGLADVYAQEAV